MQHCAKLDNLIRETNKVYERFTSSNVINFFPANTMARVTYNSTGGKSPEVAILPNALGGTQRRNVLLNRGSSSNKGDNIFAIEEGQLRKKNKCYWMSKQLLHTTSQLLSLTVFSWLSYHKQATSYYLLSVKVLSLTVLVVNPFAPHHASSLGLGSSMSNTSLLKGSDAWVRKWTSGTAYNHSWRS